MGGNGDTVRAAGVTVASLMARGADAVPGARTDLLTLWRAERTERRGCDPATVPCVKRRRTRARAFGSPSRW
jgi:hypothetical protein